jgi:glycosyltransferase involved in cell wall biosynthesis
LIRTLQAFDQQQGMQPFELIAVDDCSTDRTQDVLRSYQPRRYELKALRQDTNQGPAAARNRGLEQATAPLILFVGDDILPDPYLVEGHLAAHRYYSQPEVSVLGRVIWAADLPVNTLMAHIDGIGAQQFSYHYMQDGREYDFRHFYTANISLKRELLRSQPNGFDTQFTYAAFEDAELSFRLAQQGMRILYASHLVGYHYHYHTIWTFSLRQFRSGMMARLLANKHPATRKKLLGGKWPYRLLGWRILTSVQKNLADELAGLENQALHWASQHEWTPHPMLDRAYLTILLYFYTKGLVYGQYGDTERAARTANLLAQRRLAPLLAQVTSA